MPRLSKIGAAALAAFGWTSLSTVSASYLVVAGGGGGGTSRGGGGGAGGYQTGTTSLNPTLSYTVTVGAGGASGATYADASSNGGNSQLGTLTASVGGGAGANDGGATAGNGGSGGGGGSNFGTATSGQGNVGAVGGGSAPAYAAGGGGGAGAAGSTFSSQTAGSGGVGLASSITGTSTYYAGGGGGGTNGAGTAGSGGNGGGGAGSNASGGNGTAGTANTGGGGGGGGSWSSPNGRGGSGGAGVVIISYPAPQQFGGGVVTTSGSNVIHTFNTSGTLSPLSSLTASYLIVAGGGACVGWAGGGGGAGGLLTSSGLTIDTNSIYVVTVGAGGAGGSGASATSPSATQDGSVSSFSGVSVTATGGGSGGGYTGNARSGGSGGGGGNGSGTSNYLGASGTSGQGNAGGNALATYSVGGGGGGASAVGGNATSTTGGNGGAGTTVSSALGGGTYAGGGGGGANATSAGTGGAGGGGAGANGSPSTQVAGTSGTANTGGGGGGGSNWGTTSVTQASGGSGVVIISYAGSTQQMAGGTVTISGGNVIHTFTSSGYLTPIKYVNNSLRFRSSASAYLNRTLTTPTDNKKWTWSGWIKRGSLSNTSQGIFESPSSGSTFASIYFTSGDIINWYEASGGATVYILQTTQVFRDPAAWYHIVCAYDSTQATAANRQKMYVNGVQITAFSTATYVSQNTNGRINSAVTHKIGTFDASSNYFDGYNTEINFVDGQALTPTSFGTINSYGVWQPITYGGSYGTNGFYLPFISNSSTYAGGFNGSSQYLLTSTNASLALGTNSFTIEYWLYINSAGGGTVAVSSGNGTTTYDGLFGYQTGSQSLILYLSSTGSSWDIASGVAIGSTPTGTWNHVAITRSGNTFYTFVNGVQGATFSSSASIYQSANSISIGRAQSGTPINGNVSNLRVVVGTALYTSNFTIPTSNLTAVTNTKLLTLQNATIVDNSTNALTFTNTGSVVTGLTYPFSAAKIFSDQSPQGNNWTPNNISGAVGSTLDYMTDVPTLTSATAANYCTWNPLFRFSRSGGFAGTFSDGNLKVATGGNSTQFAGTLELCDGAYYEVTAVSIDASRSYIGLFSPSRSNLVTSSTNVAYDGTYNVLYSSDGGIWVNTTTGGNQPLTGSTWTNGDVISVAYKSGKIYLAKNGVWQNSGVPTSGTGFVASGWDAYGALLAYCGYNSTFSANFGQQPFIYTPPTGFVALNTYNM